MHFDVSDRTHTLAGHNTALSLMPINPAHSPQMPPSLSHRGLLVGVTTDWGISHTHTNQMQYPNLAPATAAVRSVPSRPHDANSGSLTHLITQVVPLLVSSTPQDLLDRTCIHVLLLKRRPGVMRMPAVSAPGSPTVMLTRRTRFPTMVCTTGRHPTPLLIDTHNLLVETEAPPATNPLVQEC